MKLPQISLKAVIALALIVGAAGIMLQLGRGEVPSPNRDLFNFALGSWFTWGTIAVKRLFEGSDSSDVKNDTINAQANALAASQATNAAQ